MSNLPNNTGSKLSVLTLLFLLLSLPVSVTLVKQYQEYQDLRTRAAVSPNLLSMTAISNQSDRMKTINSFLVKSARESTPLTKPSADTIRSLALERKKLMLSYLPQNPDRFLENALPEDVIGSLSPQLINEGLVETKKELKENLTMIIEENIPLNKVAYKYKLADKDLYLASSSQPLKGSGEVSVLAYSLDNNLVVSDPVNDIQYLSLIQYQVLGPQKTLIVIISADFDPALIDPIAMNNATFGPSDSVASYYAEISRNAASIVGEVAPVVTLNNLADRCNYTSVSSAADAVLTGMGYHIPDYRIIQYFLPTTGCNYQVNGRGYVNGQKSWIFTNGWIRIDDMIHEMGHNFGLLHANSYDCKTESLGDENTCTDIEYGDMYDEMGHPYEGILHFNAPHKLALSWIGDSEFLKIDTDQSVNLFAHELSDPGIKVVKIWRNVNQEYLYLSFRKRVGLDSLLPETITRGTNIHLTVDNTDSVKTRLIDAHPYTSPYQDDFFNSSIYDGETFTDTQTNTRIKQVSHTLNGAVIEIDIPDNYPPVIQKDINIGGLYNAPAGSLYPYYTYMYRQLNPFLSVYDYSDEVIPVMQMSNPDGSQEIINLNTLPYTATRLCQEIKCVISQDARIFPDQPGHYQIIFSATDSRGAVSALKQFDFLSIDPSGPILTQTPTPTRILPPPPSERPTYPPTPSPSLTPTPVLLTPTLAPSPTPVLSDELLLNPGFEIDNNKDGRPDNWTTNKNFTRSVGRIHSGSFAGRHFATNNAGYNISQTVKYIAGNTNYSFSGWTNIPDTSDSFTYKIQLVWKNDGGSTLRIDTLNTYNSNTGGWKQTLATVVSPAKAASVMVRMTVASLNAYIFADDFSLRRE